MGTEINVTELVKRCAKYLNMPEEELFFQVLLDGENTIKMLLFIDSVEEEMAKQGVKKDLSNKGVEFIDRLNVLQSRMEMLAIEYGSPKNIPESILQEIYKETLELKEEVYAEIDASIIKENYSNHDDMPDAFEAALHSIMREAVQKPPIGLKPKYIHDSERIAEIKEAISRYEDVKKDIPDAWLQELNSLEEAESQRLKEQHYHELEKKNQVHIITGPRNSGKTTELIKVSAETGGTIVCASEKESKRILEEAERFGFKIPTPITMEKAMSKSFRPDNPENSTLLVDNMENIFNSILNHRLKLGVFTITNYYN